MPVIIKTKYGVKEMKPTGKKCLERGQETYTIQIIDRGQKNIHYNFAYTTDDFKEKPRAYAISGFVAAEMCEIFGRNTLRATPKG
jgi:hypothetical protein